MHIIPQQQRELTDCSIALASAATEELLICRDRGHNIGVLLNHFSILIIVLSRQSSRLVCTRVYILYVLGDSNDHVFYFTAGWEKLEIVMKRMTLMMKIL